MTLHHSITLRISLSFAVLAVFVFSALGLYLGRATDAHMADLDEHELHSKFVLIRHLAAQETASGGFASRLADVLVGEHNTRVLIQASGQVIFRWPDDMPDRFWTPGLHDGLQQFTFEGHEYRVLSGPLETRWGQSAMVFIGRDIGHHTHFLHGLLKDFWLAVLAAAVLTMLVGGLIARHGMARVRAITQAASRISAGQLSERIAVAEVPPELADMVSSFNGMLERLEASFQQLSDFSADLAHELRTPIHTLRMQTEVLLSKPRAVEAYRDLLASNLEEYDRLSRIIADMLFLAKADHGLVIPEARPVDLQALCERLADYYGILADTREIHLHTEPVVISGDELMLERAVGNVLVNAIHHTPLHGQVEITLAPEAGGARLVIRNTGQPIPPQSLPGIFGRFVRLNPEMEGTGLGLAITKSIIEAHGGEIHAKSGESGTSFSFFMPSVPGGSRPPPVT